MTAEKILFDLEAMQPLGINIYDGGAEYTRTILNKLLECNLDENRLIFCMNPSKQIDNSILDRISGMKYLIEKVSSHQDLEQIIKNHGVERFYSAIPYRYKGVNFGQAKVVMTIHGLRALELPTDRFEVKYSRNLSDLLKSYLKLFLRGMYMKRLFREYRGLVRNPGLQQIIAVSNHTKYSLIQHFPELINTAIKVLYSPLKIATDPVKPHFWEDLQMTSQEYFLIVSGGRWTKNAFRAVRAFDELFSDFQETEKMVVITGMGSGIRGWKLRHPERFMFLGYIEDAYLEYLYQNAYALVFPTLNEGFGYPPLECMKYGIPVIASAITSITEVCGAIPLYFNPYSIPELKNRILHLLHDPGLYEKKSIEGRNHAESIRTKQDLDLDSLIKTIVA